MRGETVQGRRRQGVEKLDDGTTSLPDRPKPGDYWTDDDGHWWAYAPRCGIGRLDNHQVIEHEDGTITVSPSILMDGGPNRDTWHGYLERGVWREV